MRVPNAVSSMVFSDATLIFVKGHIEHPVEVILDYSLCRAFAYP